jgi:phosphodiesterase/alkaline phosphatase D-like protein
MIPAARSAFVLGLALSSAASAQSIPFTTPALLQQGSAPTGLPCGVAAGEVDTDSALLWARSATQGVVTADVSEDPTLQTGVIQASAIVGLVAKPAKLPVQGLSAGRTYFYRVTSPDGATAFGRFRTAQAEDGFHGLHFGVSGDGRGELLPFDGVANVPAAELDFFANLGDTIYADYESPILPGVTQAKRLREFLLKHAEVNQAGGDLAALRASTALLATIDDHEVTNDFAGGAHPSTDPKFDPTGNYINETQLYKNGLDAFWAYYPLRQTTYPQTGDPRTAYKTKLYRYQRYGKDAAVITLDARSFRDTELPEPDITNPASVTAFLIGAFDPTRTMLGQAQLADLKADLLDAESRGIRWKFVFVPEPIQNLGPLGGPDRFEGYAAERTQILQHIVSNGIKNVVFVAADIHGSVINNLTYQQGPGQPQLQTSMFEVTTGAIAFADPFGPTVVELAAAAGILSAPEVAFYNSLPIAGKDAFLQSAIDTFLAPLGYDSLGLQGSPVPATLVQGGYAVTHTWGWTEFVIAPGTSELTIKTWGKVPGTLDAPTVRNEVRVTPL